MKPNWELINKSRVRGGYFSSSDDDGFNGAFMLWLNRLPITVVASDGMGWFHCSVSVQGSDIPPSWSVMCQVKEIFFGDDEWVVQYHPPKSANVNNHPGCLHLWRPIGQTFPLPDPLMVGAPWKGELKSEAEAFEAMKEVREVIKRTTPGAA